MNHFIRSRCGSIDTGLIMGFAAIAARERFKVEFARVAFAFVKVMAKKMKRKMRRKMRRMKAVVTARVGWKPTKYQGIWRREDRFRVMAGRTYLGVFPSLQEAMDKMTTNGYELNEDRTRREPMKWFVEKACIYFDWAVATSFEPADFTNAIDIRRTVAHLVRVAPCTYGLHVEGKEKPWSRRLVQAYAGLSASDKMTLTMLTSGVKSECMRAAKVQHHIVCTALQAASRPDFKKERKWWGREVQHNAQHTSWLVKAQARGVLKKVKTRGGGEKARAGGGGKKARARGGGVTRGGGVKAKGRTRRGGLELGQSGSRYRVVAFNVNIAETYKDMAVLTAQLAAMPTPSTYHMYAANRQRLLAMSDRYHDLWYFRAFFEIERVVAFGTLDMPLGKTVTVEEFATVFPDSVGHVPSVARYFQTETVVTVLKKLGYTSRGLPVSLATMHLCYLGQMNRLDVDDMRQVKKHILKKATRKHANGK